MCVVLTKAVSVMRSWLADGEQVHIRCRAHARILVWPITVGLLLIVGASAALAKLQPTQFASWAPEATHLREPAIVLLLTAVILIEIAYPLRRVIRWANTRYVLTSQRVVIRGGNVRRRQEDFVLARMQGVNMRQKLGQRMVGAGELDFQLLEGGVRTLHNVPHIQDFKNYTHEVWVELFRASFQQAPGQGYYASDVDVVQTGRKRKGLRKIGRAN